MRKIREVIVVEGRYDKNTLSQIVDATVVTLGGFAVFNDREKVAFLRRLAEERGLIVLTDSDGAGFVIRNYLKGALPRDKVKQAYIPDIRGKEKRKRGGHEAGRDSGSAPPGGGDLSGRGNSAAGGKNAHHQGRPHGMGTGRGSGQQPAAAGAAAAAGSTGALDGQRDAGSPESAGEPRKIGGTAGG